MKGTGDRLRSCKTLNEINLIYFEAKLNEAKLDWGLNRLKTEKKKMTDYFWGSTVGSRISAISLEVEMYLKKSG